MEEHVSQGLQLFEGVRDWVDDLTLSQGTEILANFPSQFI
jgi:hypothetical protein